MPAPARSTVARLAAAAALALPIGLAVASPANAAAPAKPTNLALHAIGSSDYLSWSSKRQTTFVIEAGTSSSFPSGSYRSFRVRGYSNVFTPYGLTAGTVYYYRVKAVNSSGTSSHWSNTAHGVAPIAGAGVRVMSYNVLGATHDGESRSNGVTVAPYSQRRPPMLALINNSHAGVIGFQEAASCIGPKHPCTRQIDDIMNGLTNNYTLDDTWTHSGGNKYISNYIVYDHNLLNPIGNGYYKPIGPSSSVRYVVFQEFQVQGSSAKFVFATTHLVATVGSQANIDRGTSTTKMLDTVSAYARQHGVSSIVYTGDFNTYVGEWHVNDISGNNMRAAGVPDGIAVAQHRKLAKYDSFNDYQPRPKQGHGSIDHIYPSAGVAITTWGEYLHLKNGTFDGPIPSDHNPIYADLLFPA